MEETLGTVYRQYRGLLWRGKCLKCCKMSTEVFIAKVRSFFLFEHALYNVNIKVPLCNHRYSGKAIMLHIMSVWEVSSTQSACVVLYCHLWPVSLYHIFPHYLINGTIVGGGEVIDHKMCFDFLYSFLSGTFFISRKIRRDNINIHRPSSKVPANLARC